MDDTERYRAAVGFAQWHLEKEHTPAQMLAAFRKHDRFDDFSDEELYEAIRRAQRNRDLTDLFCTAKGDITIAQCREALDRLEGKEG
jgi:hypothetical protein